MDYIISSENFESLASIWKNPENALRWEPLFILPPFLSVWWQSFGAGFELCLLSVKSNGRIIGVAPLMLKDNTAGIIGSEDVCDFLDFIVVPGEEQHFFNVLLDELGRKGVTSLDVNPVRSDSAVITSLIPVARARGREVICRQEAVSVEVELPASWDEYLDMLDKKQRHEIRRKIKNLFETEKVEHRCFKPDVSEVVSLMDTFLGLFALTHKAGFMSSQMESYFRLLAVTMAENGLFNVSTLKLNSVIVSMTLGFDYNNALYFYNSAYDPACRHLSVGVISKVLCLKHGIEAGRAKGDFLKGAEKYKYHIGGREIPLAACRIVLG